MILLINPWEAEVFPPPGLGYLQAVLKQAGHNVVSKDLSEALQDKENYDIVAVSFHSFSVKYARQIREYFKDTWLVCGGHHPSALPEQLLGIGYDQVVVGEGENAILEILNGEKDRILQGKSVDIESVPIPDYTGFSGNWDMGIPVISSRGCPFDCSFCASSSFWHRKWKMRSAEKVLAEIATIQGKQFMFEDDNFTINRTRVLEICRQLNGKGYTWQCASRAETLMDSELCWYLKQAGCHTVWCGIESLSQETLDRNRKNTTVEKMLTGIATAEGIGLHTMSQFIVGLPDDTEANITETVQNIKKSKIQRKGLQILWIVPNTKAYFIAKEKGFNDEIYLNTGAPFYTYEQDINTLNRWYNLINAS